MKQLTDHQKTMFFVYKEIDEESFPADRVWKLWIPLPGTMPGGLWMQFPSHEEAMSVAMLPDKELGEYLDDAWEEGGW